MADRNTPPAPADALVHRPRLPSGASPVALWAAVLALALATAGCTTPGFSHPETARWSGGSEGAPGSAGGPRLAPITAQLIREQAGARPQALAPQVRQLLGTAPAYTIGPGDVVGITVYRHPELMPQAGAVVNAQSDATGVAVPPGFIVDGEGDVAFPYVGRLRLAGLTEAQATALIAQRIGPYVKEPLVSARIQSFRSRRVYVEGDVRTPGLQIVTDVPMTLAEALQRAGSTNASADRSRITLTRGALSTRIDLLQLHQHGHHAGEIPLQAGDRVHVASRDDSRVYVMGEVVRPAAVPLRDGHLSLGEALGDVSGPDLQTSAPGRIYVVRNAQSDAPDVFHLDARNPVALALADRFELQPRDVVYVDRVGLVGWNRVISLILPAAQVVNLGGTAGRR